MSLSLSSDNAEGIRQACAPSTVPLIVQGILFSVLGLLVEFRTLLDFEKWSAFDIGSYTPLVRLLHSGLKPNVDFSFTYGPITVLVCEAWSWLTGGSWFAFLLFYVLIKVFQSFLMILLARRLLLTGPMLFAFLAGMVWSHGGAPSLGPLCERCFLLLGVYCLTFGSLRWALCSAVLAVGLRPSVGFLFGLLVLVLIGQSILWQKSDFRSKAAALVWNLAPAAVTTFATALAYSLCFGLTSYSATVIPFAGMRLYTKFSSNVLTHGLSQFIFLDRNVNWYLANPTLLTLFALVVLLCGLAWALIQTFSGMPIPRPHSMAAARTVQLSAGLIIVLAMTFMYGGGSVFTYYCPLIWVGFFATLQLYSGNAPWLTNSVAILCAVTIMVFLAATGWLEYRAAKQSVFVPTTCLLIDVGTRKDLETVAQMTGGKRVAFAPNMGDVMLLHLVGIETVPIPYWCFQPGLATIAEQDMVRQDVFAADFVLVKPATQHSTENAAMIGIDEHNTKLIYSGQDYKLYRNLMLPNH